MTGSPGEIARKWLRAWETQDLDLLDLDPDFVHTSPFGRFEGAEEYLRVVEPMSKKSVVAITVLDVLEGEGRAAIAYELETPAGTVEACDWVFVRDGRIVEVRAYYDSVTNREALKGEVDRLPIVGVMGSGSESHQPLASLVGSLLADLGVHLLTGGGRGVMEAVSKSFHETSGRRGLVVGVLPAGEALGSAREGYPNPWVEMRIQTHLPLSGEQGMKAMSRNHINVLSADAVVALPGGTGTASEVALALRYGRPVIACVSDRAQIPGLPAEVPVTETREGLEAFLRRAIELGGEE